MEATRIHVCQCQLCKLGVEHSHKSRHQQINLLMSCLNEQQQRWFAAIEANRIGHGGARFVSHITGLDEAIIINAQKELVEELHNLRMEQSGFLTLEQPEFLKGVS